MKKIASIVLILAAAVVAVAAFSSCSALSGTTIGFTEKGVTITPPATPIVITK